MCLCSAQQEMKPATLLLLQLLRVRAKCIVAVLLHPTEDSSTLLQDLPTLAHLCKHSDDCGAGNHNKAKAALLHGSVQFPKALQVHIAEAEVPDQVLLKELARCFTCADQCCRGWAWNCLVLRGCLQSPDPSLHSPCSLPALSPSCVLVQGAGAPRH